MKRTNRNLMIMAMLLGGMLTYTSPAVAQARISASGGPERMSGHRGAGSAATMSQQSSSSRMQPSASRQQMQSARPQAQPERRSEQSAASRSTFEGGRRPGMATTTRSAERQTGTVRSSQPDRRYDGTGSRPSTSAGDYSRWQTNGTSTSQGRQATMSTGRRPTTSSQPSVTRPDGNNYTSHGVGSGNLSNGRPGGTTGNTRPGYNGNNNNSNNGNGGRRPGYNGNNGGFSNRPGGNSSMRPGSNNYRPDGNFRPDANRPGSGYYSHNDRKYDRYRYDGKMRPRGGDDRFYRNYRHNDWRRPVMPPERRYRPAALWYYRPTMPAYYRPYYAAPSIVSILGVDFGTMFGPSLNFLYYKGYDIDGYYDNIVYLRNVSMLSFTWPDVMMRYDPDSGLNYAQFVYSTPYFDRSRYNRIYHDLCATYGQPINYGGSDMRLSWYGGDGRGYVTLSLNSNGGRYYTSLSVGY